MDVDYDATVFFLYKKHEGDWEKIVRSFRSFLNFVQTLGPDEKRQLSHVEPEMMTERVLQHRLRYFVWRAEQKRRETRTTRHARTRVVCDEDLEDDVVFGGKARPSSHNVLVESLSTKLEAIVGGVKSRLPTIEDNESGDESDGSEMPEVFFSGLDWTKIKLPGDNGFSWNDSDNDNTYNDNTDADSPKPASTHCATAQKAGAECMNQAATTRPLTSQQLAASVLPSSIFPKPSTVTEELDKLEADMKNGRVDFDAWKRMLNPSRPTRPSECTYDVDGFPVSGISMDVQESPVFDDEIAAYLRKATGQPPPSNDAEQQEPARDRIRASPQQPQQQQPQQLQLQQQEQQQQPEQQQQKQQHHQRQQPRQQPQQRSGRWTIVEHSDSSDEGESASHGKGHKGQKGGYKGGKQGKAHAPNP